MFTIQQVFDQALQHHNEGRLSEAETLYRQVLAVEPNHADALHFLGVLALQMEKYDLAIALVNRALQIHPNYPSAISNLGEIHRRMGQLDEAIAYQRRALEIQPDYFEALHNLGVALNAKGDSDQALPLLRRALEINPGVAGSYASLGHALQKLGAMDEAIAAFRHSIALEPGEADFHWNVALALLAIGHFREGWEEFEWRVKRPKLGRPDLATPPWNGEDLAGRTLLIHQEGGFGDVIHFMRYLPMVRARGAGQIVFEGQAAILSWMKLQPGIDAVIERGRSLPAHDFHCAPQSFPHVFGTELHNIPAAVPYLLVDEEKVAAWRHKLAGIASPESGQRAPFLVGLCWAGSPLAIDRRSRTLVTFAPLTQVPGVTFVSLQKGPEAAQVKERPEGMSVVDVAAEVENFSDLAALVFCMDAVATVDTSVAHLAGALGKPTWILLPQHADFRWMIDRPDSPWYPTARLFRQQDAGNWEEPVQRMVEALRQPMETAPTASTSMRQTR